MTTAAWPVQVAVATALAADSALDALLARHVVAATTLALYNGVAPEGAALDYVVLGEPTEGAFGTFGRAGADGTLRLHVYTADESNAAALAIFTRLAAVLDQARLTLTGHTMVHGALTLETSFRDPAGGRHLVARYATLATVAA